MSRWLATLPLVLATFAAPTLALAQEEAPAEEAAAEEEAPATEVDLTAEFGGILLWGNTRSISLSGKVNFALKRDRNGFSLEVGGAYGRGRTADDVWEDIARTVYLTARYDRFFTDRNSLYVSGGFTHDPFAGFDFRVTGNIGYSHIVVQTEVHELKLEGGFNYTRDDYVDGVDPNVQNFIGGRAFVGYKATPNENVGFTQTVEAVIGGTDNTDASFDGRLISDTAIAAKVASALAISFGFNVNWDFAPPEGFEPVDLTTKIALVATIL